MKIITSFREERVASAIAFKVVGKIGKEPETWKDRRGKRAWPVNGFPHVWSGGEQLGVSVMTWTAESLKLLGWQMCWDLEQMRTVICKPGVGLRVCFSDRLPGDIEVVGTWVPH